MFETALKNPLVQELFDDIAYKVGLKKWVSWMLMTGVIAYAGYAYNGMGSWLMLIGGIVMTLNLGVAALLTYWWKRWGREKYGYKSMLDAVMDQEGRQ